MRRRGSSRAVVVQGVPLVHTRQLLPEDRNGKMVEGSVDKQIDQLLANIDAVLTDSGSSMSKLIRLNVYALSPATITRFQEVLAKKLDPSVRPAMTTILTAMPHPGALVAADALAAGSDKGPGVVRQRCQTVGGDKDYADAAVYAARRRGLFLGPAGRRRAHDDGRHQVDDHADEDARSVEALACRRGCKLKVFCKPASAADDVMRELKKFFPGQMVPPVLFIEWLTTIPVEIEMVARLPQDKKPAGSLVHYNPPDCVSFPSFSRIALVYTDRQIYIGGLFGQGASKEEGENLFAKLGEVLSKAGSDPLHMAKASYYVTDDNSARFFDKAPLEVPRSSVSACGLQGEYPRSGRGRAHDDSRYDCRGQVAAKAASAGRCDAYRSSFAVKGVKMSRKVNRREFVAATAAAGVGLALASGSGRVLAAEKPGHSRRHAGAQGQLAQVAGVARSLGTGHHQGAAQRPMVPGGRRRRGSGLRGGLREVARGKALPGHGQRHHGPDHEHLRGRGGCRRRGNLFALHL